MIMPLSAAGSYTEKGVSLGGANVWKAFDYIHGTDSGAYEHLPKLLWMPGDNPIYAPEYTAASPFCVTLSDFSYSWHHDQWTYVSIELAVFETASHWSLGFYERFTGAGYEYVVRLIWYEADTGYTHTVFEFVTSDIEGILDPTVSAEYWTEYENDGTEYTMCRVFFDTAVNMYDESYTFRIDEPFKVRVKTEYAGVTYRKTVGDTRYKSGYDAGVADGYSEGHLAGHEAGFNAGVDTGEQNILDRIKEYLTEQGVLLDTGTNLEALMGKLKDIGRTEMLDQGLITQKLIVTLIDAPVNMVLASLNFDMFGFNLSSVVMSIFSIAVTYVLVAAVLKILPLV